MNDRIRFGTEEDIPTEQLEAMKQAREDIKDVLDKHEIDNSSAVSLFLNFMELAIHRLNKDKTAREEYELFRKTCNEYIDLKMKMCEEMCPGSLDAKPDPVQDLLSYIKQIINERTTLLKNPHEFYFECSLCGNKTTIKPGTSITAPNPKIHRLETEGCPSCYKGKGHIIAGTSFYDKDGNLLIHMSKEDLHQPAKKIQEKLMTL